MIKDLWIAVAKPSQYKKFFGDGVGRSIGYVLMIVAMGFVMSTFIPFMQIMYGSDLQMFRYVPNSVLKAMGTLIAALLYILFAFRDNHDDNDDGHIENFDEKYGVVDLRHI